MTGRELIVYILENHLENEEICKIGKIVGFLSIEEAAEKFEVGPATIVALYNMHKLRGVTIGDKIYILTNPESPGNMR